MRRHPRVWTRAERLAVVLERRALQREAVVIAAAAGIEPGQLIAEAEALVARARLAGAVTWAEINAWAARELGCDPAELYADTARIGSKGDV